jgi:hypothetical protein
MAEPPTVPPSGKESCGYYIGLSDCPTLVGRSITVYDNDVYEKLILLKSMLLFRCGMTLQARCVARFVKL